MSAFGDFRSAEYRLEIGGIHYLSDVVVGVRSGWIIEVRATFATDVSSLQSAEDAVGDAAMPGVAFMTAVGSVGHTTSPQQPAGAR